MPEISLPFYNDEKTITVPNWGTVTLQAYQILVYLSITERGAPSCHGAPIFPAIFDTGNSLCLTIHDKQFEAAKPWGMNFERLRQTYKIRGLSGSVSFADAFNANAWLHNYTPSDVPKIYRVPETDSRHFKLELAHEGIACISKTNQMGYDLNQYYDELLDRTRLRNEHSDSLAFPHLPLLGLRALCINSFDLRMNCNPFGGYLYINKK